MEKKMKKTRISPFSVIVLILLCAYTLILFGPLIWGLNVSLKTSINAVNFPFSVQWPFRFENFATVFKEFKVEKSIYRGGVFLRKDVFYMEHMLWFTFVYAVLCSLVNVGVVCLVAYVTARYRSFLICRIVDAIVIIAMILPIVGSMASELRIMRALGFYNSLWGMLVMKANFLGGTNFLIFNATFRNLPKDFAEAAQLDGAGHFTIMMRIMMPLVRNIFFTLWLLMFIQFWNDYQTPLLYFPDRPTLAYGLYQWAQTTTGAGKAIPLKLAACFILMVPILIVFLFTSEKLIGNVSMGGLKE